MKFIAAFVLLAVCAGAKAARLLVQEQASRSHYYHL
jgi:hypothetical protein